MINISNNGFISINRGDTFTVPLFINKGTKQDPVRLYVQNHPNAEVFLGVMEPNQSFEHAIIKKRFTPSSDVNQFGDLVLSFKDTDTINLLPGLYYYCIKARLEEYEHNINCPLSDSTELLVYGWKDEFKDTSLEDLKLKFPHIDMDDPLEMILVNTATGKFHSVYVGYDDNFVLQVYNSVSAKGKPQGWIAEISLSKFASLVETALANIVVDTIRPSTEFLILE